MTNDPLPVGNVHQRMRRVRQGETAARCRRTVLKQSTMYLVIGVASPDVATRFYGQYGQRYTRSLVQDH